MAQRPAPSNLRLILRIVACAYLLILSFQLAGNLHKYEGTMKIVMIGAIILFAGVSIVAIIGTVRRHLASKAQSETTEQEPAAEEPIANPVEAITAPVDAPEESAAALDPETTAASMEPLPVADPVEEDEGELPDDFDLETEMLKIARLAEEGKIEAMERHSEKVKRALARQDETEQADNSD